jgi:hypothetical protein
VPHWPPTRPKALRKPARTAPRARKYPPVVARAVRPGRCWPCLVPNYRARGAPSAWPYKHPAPSAPQFGARDRGTAGLGSRKGEREKKTETPAASTSLDLGQCDQPDESDQRTSTSSTPRSSTPCISSSAPRGRGPLFYSRIGSPGYALSGSLAEQGRSEHRAEQGRAAQIRTACASPNNDDACRALVQNTRISSRQNRLPPDDHVVESNSRDCTWWLGSKYRE